MERKEKIKLSTRNKFILAGLITTTALVIGSGIWAISEVQNKMDTLYQNYAQTISKTLSIDSGAFEENKSEIIKERLGGLLKVAKDILYIEYRNENNELVYAAKSEKKFKNTDAKIVVSAPVYSKDNDIIGSVSIAMNGLGIKDVAKTTQNTLFMVFLLTWLTFMAVLIVNAILTGRELELLHDAVNRISTGQFGLKLETPDSGSEIKKLTNAFNDMSNILYQYDEQNFERIALERNKLEAVLMSIINGVIVCDNDDKVVLLNNAAQKLLGVDGEELINTKLQEYTDSNDLKCFREKIEEYKDTPIDVSRIQPLEFELELNSRTVKAMISPMFSSTRDYLGYIIVLIDITREAEVNKLKNVFISNVSHELRTPVTVLRSYMDTLCTEGEALDEETKKEFLQTVNTEVQRLHSMVNDILDFSRLESPNIKLQKDLYDIVPIIERVISSMKVLADEKGMKINFTSADNLPQIPIHAESIERAIKNLISNAIKYSPEGKDIEISVKMSESPDFVEIDVKDHGIGIAQKDLDKIFERFYRVENKVHSVKGTGIGLHLVKTTIETHHHGQIYVQSKEGEGSTFAVLLPLKQEDDGLV
ncbi:PAS domain S-box protein [bacterium]|nr:PAS domain S-box protein [bacterium]